ncbi:MAG: hypothetical protein N5P05_004502 (plasmid) [Chroococcopsis gigantea SAG 12.99]|nr:hypothetical protein [Chroococcopsis gigantea SAG 12.99]
MSSRRRYIVIYDRATTNPFSTLMSLILFCAIITIPRLIAITADKSPEGALKAGYSSLGDTHGGPALQEFQKAESMPRITNRQRVKIHLGKALANQRALEIVHSARPIILEGAINQEQTMRELNKNEKMASDMIARDVDKALVYSQKAGLGECSRALKAIKNSFGNTEKDTWKKLLSASKPCRDS